MAKSWNQHVSTSVTALLCLLLLIFSDSALAQPAFTAEFQPNTIGPGSSALLVFEVDNESGSPVTDLAFSNVLPAGLTIADAAGAQTTCGDSAALLAPAGGGTITFSQGQVSASSICTVAVLVTSSTEGLYENASGALTSSAGNSGTATANLTVAADRPGFSKSFAPATVPLGGRSTLTFTIDNSLNPSSIFNLDFTDNLPTGMEIADPSNASTDCIASSAPNTTVAAAPASNIITLDANGFNSVSGFEVLSAGETCTVAVDVVATGVGQLENVTNDLLDDFTAVGKAAATLNVTRTDISLVKRFTDDPVPPGGTVTLEFEIFNFDRSESATNLAFTDDLGATLAGLTFNSLLFSDCGGTVNGVGTTSLSFSGGTVASGASCIVRTSLTVPQAAVPGIYANTTDTLSGLLGGSPVTGNAASDDLFVDPAPVIVKEFLDDPVNPGDTVELQFTITNTSAISGAMDIAFEDVFDVILPTASVLPGDDCCGSGSSCGFSALADPPAPSPTVPASFTLSGGSLAPAGQPGDSCTFSLTLDVDIDAPGGTYPNTTSQITATVDGAESTGEAASDDLIVISAPTLIKQFTDDPAQPGDTVTLEFTLRHPAEAPGPATGITFTDNLNAALAGLTASLPPSPNPPCGDDSSLTGSNGDTFLTFAGGSLLPGDECTFSVQVDIPNAAALGSYTNTTSGVAASISGSPATSAAASDSLVITGLSFSKEFIDNPVLPGGTTTLRFTIENLDPLLDVSDIRFTYNLAAVRPGPPDLSVITALPASFCGGTLSLSGSVLFFSGGSILASDPPCTFDLLLQVPAGAANGSYTRSTSDLLATQGGAITIPPAVDRLTIDNELLALAKEFTDDPGIPGGTVTLEFTLNNLSSTETITNIAFSDDLDAAVSGLVSESGIQNDVCGTGSSLSGTGVLSLTNASLDPGAQCTFSVTLRIPAVALDNAVNTTSAVTGSVGSLAVQGDAASDTLSINNVTFSKSFSGPSAATGAVTLSFTIDNLSASNGIAGLQFIDNLNAVIPGLVATNTPLSNICGTGSSISGTSSLTFTSGQLGASESCTFNVVLQVPASATAGSFNNTTSNLQANGLTVAPPASANLSIQPPPTFSKVFSPNAIALNGISTLTFTINNSASSIAASGLIFTDSLPANLVVANPPNASASTTCIGGSLTAAAGTSVISYTGGSVAAGSACSVSVDVTSAVEGVYTNVSRDLTSSSGNSGTSTDALNVVADEFGLTKSFRTSPVVPGGLVEMELSIVNNSDFPLTAIALTDNLGVVLTDLAAEGLPLADGCGAGSQLTGTSVLTLTGGNLPAGASCTLVARVRVPIGAASGTYTNTTSLGSAQREGVGVEAPATSATLTVETIGFTKTFAPDLISAGGTTTATFTITNPDAANTLVNVAFSDDLETFLPGAVATNLPLGNVCGPGSTVTGTSTVALSGAQVPAGGSCSFPVIISTPTETAAGDYTNTTSALTGDTSAVAGQAFSLPGAEATLAIDAPLAFSMAFDPDNVAVGAASQLTFTIDNSAGQLDASDIAFSIQLPDPFTNAGSIPNTCGGSFSLSESGDRPARFGLSGGRVSAGSLCSITVRVSSNEAGNFVSETSTLTSSAGTSPAATATIVVRALPTLTKTFTPASIAVNGTSTLTFTIDHSAGLLDLTDLAFTDDLPQGLLVASPTTVSGTCSSMITTSAGAASISMSQGELNAGESCTISVDVTGTEPGTFLNETSTLTSNAGTSPAAQATITVNQAPAFSKAFAPQTIQVSATSTVTFTIDNSAEVVEATDLAFSDPLPAGLVLADPANAVTTCDGGTLTAAAGGSAIDYSGGTVVAGATCTVTAEVTASEPGVYANTTSDLTSSLGNSGPATAELTVRDDTDGVAAEVEDRAPNNGDGNNDGTPDRFQDNVASLPTFDDTSMITVSITNGCATLELVQALNPASQSQPPPADLEFPFGLVGFEIPCENATVEVIFHGANETAGDAYFKFGPTTPDQTTTEWFDLANPAAPEISRASLSGNTWTLTLADNQLGDSTGDDGRIVDPAGPATRAEPAEPAIPVPTLNLPSLLILLILLTLTASYTHALRIRNP